MEIENIKYSLKNLAKRKSRSFLTILSIFIGIVMIFIFISFGWGLYDYVNGIASSSGADKFVVTAKGIGAPGIDSTFKLLQKDLDTIRKSQGVAEASGYYIKPLKVEKDSKSFFTFGLGHTGSAADEKFFTQIMGIKLTEGRDLKPGDKGKIVLGNNYEIPDKIFASSVKLGDKILINGQRFEVIGFYPNVGNPQDDANIYMIDTDLKSLFPNETLSYGQIIGRVSNVKTIDDAINQITKDLRRERGLKEGREDFFVQSFQQLIEQYQMILNIIIGFIILIALISVIVSAINTANTMITSVLERTREIGIMKAVGARNSTIRNIFLFESTVLGGVAGVFGTIVGFFITEIGKTLLNTLGYGFLKPHYSLTLFLGTILFAAVIGTISGVTVAIQASHQNPVDSLRYE